MSLVNKLQSTDVSPRTVLFSIVILVLATAGVLTVVVKLMNGPSTPRERETQLLPVPTVSTVTRDPGKTTAALPVEADYGVIVKRNLFRPTGTAVAAVAAPPPQLPPPVLPVKPPEKPAVVPPFKPIVNTAPTTPPVAQPKLAYTGVVEIASETYALIEHLDKHEAQYVSKGGAAFECKVVEITPIAVAIEYMGTPFTLTLGENKKEEAAPPPAAPPGNPPPGQP
ncbi:MAG: hypothetical protein ACYDCO_24655, partial [Armatimonadota bacterium]